MAMAVQEVANKACATLLFGLASGKLPEVMEIVSSDKNAAAFGRSSLLGCLNGADASISIDPTKFERVVKDDQPLKEAHDAATAAVASAVRTSLTSVSPLQLAPQGEDEEELSGISVDDLRDKLHNKITCAFDSGTLEKMFGDLADEKQKVPSGGLQEVADVIVDDDGLGEIEVDSLRLKVLGRFTDALDSGELDQAFEGIKSDKGDEPRAAEAPKKPRNQRASLAEMPPALLIDTQKEAESCHPRHEVTSPAPEKRRLSAEAVPPAVPTQKDLEASKAEPMKMRSRWRASVSEVPPPPPCAPAEGAPAAQAAKAAQPAAEKAAENAQENEDALEAQLRCLARDVLISASTDGRLAAALEASGNDSEVAKTVAGASSEPSAPAVGSNAAPTPPVQASPLPTEAMKAPPAAVESSSSTAAVMGNPNSAMALTMEAVAQRDRRVGELLAMISEAKRQIADREERCLLMEEKLTVAKADMAHLELDVEWYTRALDNAKERSGTLEERKRQLIGELDGHTLKLRHSGIDALECGMSAPSEVSTATGGGTQSSIGCFTPGTAQTVQSDIASPRR